MLSARLLPARLGLLSFLTFALVSSGAGQQAKKSILDGDWKRVEALSSALISPNGKWISYVLSPVEGDPSLTVKSADEPIAWSIPGGRGARFAKNNQFVAFLISPPRAIAEKLRAERKPANPRLGLRLLPSGEERYVENVEQFELLEDGKYILTRRSRALDSKEPRSDLTLIESATGQTLTIGNVVSASVNKAENLIAMQIASDNDEGGVQILEPGTGRVKTLMWGRDRIAGIAWSEKANVLAWLAGSELPNKVGINYRIHALTLEGTEPKDRAVYEIGKDEKLPAGFRISETRPLRVNDAGTKVAFGIQAWADKPKPAKPGEVSDVEVWNTKDIDIVPQQKVRYRALQGRTDLMVWDRSANTATRLSNGKDQVAILMDDFQKAVLLDSGPYESPVTNGRTAQDVYIVDVATRESKKVVTKANFGALPSPEGKYFVHFANKQWFLTDVRTGVTESVTGKSGIQFEDSGNDLVLPERGPAENPYWFAGDEAVIFSTYYDAFLYRPSAKTLTRLTEGAKEKVRYSPIDVLDDPEGPKLSDPIFFSVFDDTTKASGFARGTTTGELKPLLFQDKATQALTQAPGTDRMMFVMGGFDDSPAIYITNTSFSAAKPVGRSNPWLKDYAWGKSELVPFKSRWGKALNGVLIYPANYDSSRRYPMVTYIYERLSDSLHSFVRPLEASAYNEQWLSQNGYFVFKPDIAYREGTPGQDAVDCLQPALAAVYAKKLGIDPDRVGLIGHSWGAYQTAFATTVTKSFAVGVAGATLTELVSMYSVVYWNSGTPNGEIFETSQGRMGRPFWEIPEKYIANSPVWQAQKRSVPLLMAHGDADGAVDFRQGVQFYNTLRRLGKPAVLLVYPGENHNLAKPSNRLDYAKRLRHYLDVYLKGAKPESWITDGVPYTPPLVPGGPGTGPGSGG